ncbi:hypothetical protein LQ384_28800 [Rhodococcus rhodochrous]|uniref:Uncharacterized protein n=1 Tax=Rhodococcus rhodochrous TaxID=1829 RepID=A0AAW4XN37_RHORH|nr:hypothetical protein [Rhodococcus rhodochrous]MCD2115073.1 hypothetical protein [Rhodococcus rhodochrous]
MASLIDASNGNESDAIAHGPVLLARPEGSSRMPPHRDEHEGRSKSAPLSVTIER